MLLVNQVLHNRYRIMRQLGHGGMGAVYEAHDSVFDTTCAVKEITMDLSKSGQQEMLLLAFEREAKLLAKIKHEAVPHVRDYFTEDMRQYLVMELVEGKDLGDLMEERKGPFPIDDVVRWTDLLLDGLDYLHTQNPPIYHRDLKPQNLKLTPRGKIKLLDFGIAKGGAEITNAATVSNQTFVAATLNYSPIEQIFRVLDPVFREVLTQRYEARVQAVMQQNADARSDLYALGATVYHLLTGVLPIDALKRTIEVWSGKKDPLEHPSAVNNRIPPEVSMVLLKSMELDHGRRYVTALEMQQALQQAVAAGKSREANQVQNTLEMSNPPAGWSSDSERLRQDALQATRLGVPPVLPTDATQQIPPELIQSVANHGVSEETIQGGSVGFPQNFTGGSQPPSTPNSPFDSAGAQPTAFGGMNVMNTGGNVASPGFPQNQFSTGGQSTPNQFSTGGQSTANQFQPNVNMAPSYVAEQPKKSRKLLWILPILLLLFVGGVGAAGGLFLWYQSNGGSGTLNTTPTPVVSPSAAASVSPSATVSPSASPSVSPSTSPTDTPGKGDTTKPTVVPTTKPVVPTTQPTRPQTQKPTGKTPPKKNSDCIFSGDC